MGDYQSNMYDKSNGTAARSLKTVKNAGEWASSPLQSQLKYGKIDNSKYVPKTTKYDAKISSLTKQYESRSISKPQLFDASGAKTTYLKNATKNVSAPSSRAQIKALTNAQASKIKHARLEVSKVDKKISARKHASAKRRGVRDGVSEMTVGNVVSTKDVNGRDVGAQNELRTAKQGARMGVDAIKGTVNQARKFHAGRFERAEKRELRKMKRELRAERRDVAKAHRLKTKARRATMTPQQVKADKKMIRKAWQRKHWQRIYNARIRARHSLVSTIKSIPRNIAALPGNIVAGIRNLLKNLGKAVMQSVARIFAMLLGVAFVAGTLLIVVLLPLFFAGGGETVSGYQTPEEAILASEHDFVQLEEALEESLEEANVRARFPGFDDYVINLPAEGFNHNAYDLASYLNAMYGDYSNMDLSTILKSFLDDMYEVTYKSSTYTDANGNIKKRLTVDVKKKSADTVARERLAGNSEKLELYALYQETNGQNPDLFDTEQQLITNEGQRFNYYDFLYGEGNINPNNPKWSHVYDVATSNPFSAAMFNAAAPHLGTPYVWGGATPNGWDCSGFVCWTINNSVGNVGRMTANNLRVRATDNVSSSEAMPGDLIFFHGTTNTSVWGQASHVGIYLGNGYMIHAGGVKTGTVIANINTKWYQEHLLGFGRLKSEYVG